MTLRVVAVDWSGAAHGAERGIWLSEAGSDGLRTLENGRDRGEIVARLIDMGRGALEGGLVVGLDFAFSMPAWWLHRCGFRAAPELWEAASKGLCEEWLRDARSPFWGRRGTSKPVGFELYRRTEREAPVRPKSVFQIGGAGQVGTGSLRGFAALHSLKQAGFEIWPFTEPAALRAVEIYPRLFTGRVKTSDLDARREVLATRYPGLPGPFRLLAEGSADAFDAAVSALEMWKDRAALSMPPRSLAAEFVLEGAIWGVPT